VIPTTTRQGINFLGAGDADANFQELRLARHLSMATVHAAEPNALMVYATAIQQQLIRSTP
jgi:hypothetical protein